MSAMNYSPIREESKKPICPHWEKEIASMQYFEQSGVAAYAKSIEDAKDRKIIKRRNALLKTVNER